MNRGLRCRLGIHDWECHRVIGGRSAPDRCARCGRLSRRARFENYVTLLPAWADLARVEPTVAGQARRIEQAVRLSAYGVSDEMISWVGKIAARNRITSEDLMMLGQRGVEIRTGAYPTTKTQTRCGQWKNEGPGTPTRCVFAEAHRGAHGYMLPSGIVETDQ